MAVSIQQLHKAGLTQEKLKALFTQSPQQRSPELQSLYDILLRRQADGLAQNFRDYRIYYAIDLAYDAAFHQTTPTLVRRIADQMNKDNLSAKQVIELCKSLDVPFDYLFCKKEGPNGNSEWTLKPTPPTLFNIRIPIVKTYVIARLAKLFNERNHDPLLPYYPRVDTARNRLQAEAITSLISKVSDDLGYPSYLRQMILNAEMYNDALMFPLETWYVESQLDDDGNEIVVKEGTRYACPRPERRFFDLRFPTATFNTDTGCTYGAYWRLQTYGEIKNNPFYWNKESIPFGTQWWDTRYSFGFFQEIYPCKFFPEGFGVPVAESTDRETRAAYYTTALEDKAVFLTNHFMKLKPSQYGIGDYDYDIWMRFELANDNTVLWAEPVPYSPILYLGYDSDGSRSRNSSLALDILPWQELLGNALSQLLLATKQNLANFVFYDKRVISQDDIKQVENAGELALRSMNFIGYDSDKLKRMLGGGAIQQSIHPVQLSRFNTVELTNVLTVITTMLERQLGLSAQEIGQAASHEQTVPEVRITAAAGDSRMRFTGSYVDEFIGAWKKQLWEAFQQFGDKEFVAQISFESSKMSELLTELGFNVLDKPHIRPDSPVQVSANVDKIELDSFASQDNESVEELDKEKANIFLQAVTAIANSPTLGPAVGADPLLRLMSRAMQYLTGEDDLEFARSPEQIAQQKQQEEAQGQQQQQELIAEVSNLAQQAIQKLAPQLLQATEQQTEKIVEPVAAAVNDIKAQQDELAKLVLKLQQFQQTVAHVSAPAPPMPFSPGPQPVS